MDKVLGTLEKVGLREYWEGEASDFTPWLSREENLKLLADTIGLDLELVGIEQEVGDFSADIVAKDPVSGDSVIIENQLERSNHDHLGKLITYASDRRAATVVWVAKKIRPEHRQAIDWLNEVTKESVNFFGLEVELWRIGNSTAAPKFTVVSQPNSWVPNLSKSASSSSKDAAVSETGELQLKFWTKFKEFCEEGETSLKLRRPMPLHWYGISVGRVGVYISLTYKIAKQTVGCELYMENNQSKDAFLRIEAEKAQIEAELGPLEWQCPVENGRRGWIAQARTGNLNSEESWPEIFAWLKERAEAFYNVFSPRVKALKLDAEGQLASA